MSERSDTTPEAEWGPAVVRGALILAGAILGFGIVPDRLVALLSSRTSPAVRDLLVTAWVALWFIALGWGLVRLQRRGGP